MKRLLLFLTAVFMCVVVLSQGTVTQMVKKYESGQPALFWNRLGTEHPQIKAMKKAIKAKKPAMQTALQGVGDLYLLRDKAKKIAIINAKTDTIITLVNEVTQIKNSYNNVQFFIVNNSEMNACMYPEGTCLINTGLLENAINMEEVIAVVAHEIAHYVLSHTINDSWRTAKAIKRNQTWAEIGTAFAIGAYGASQIHSAQYGVQQSQESQQQMYNNLSTAGMRIREEIGLRTDIFTRLRYMRETEEEADETAFWFLEKNGIDPINYINFWKRYDASIPYSLKAANNKTKYSDHPDNAKRIQNLENLYSKYHNSNFTPNKTLEIYKKAIGAEDINSFYFMDKQGQLHSDRNCPFLAYDGFSYSLKVERLKEEPQFCTRCIDDKTKTEIIQQLSSSSQK